MLRCINLLGTPSNRPYSYRRPEITGTNEPRCALREGCEMVFQQFNLFGHLTVENVMIGQIKVLGESRKERAGSQTARLLVLLIEADFKPQRTRWTAATVAIAHHANAPKRTSFDEHPRLTPSIRLMFWTLCGAELE